MKSPGELNEKVVEEPMRHAKIRGMLDVYNQASLTASESSETTPELNSLLNGDGQAGRILTR